MILVKATMKDLATVNHIVRNTIETIYTKYYPEGAVEFFLNHHSNEAIKKAISDKSVYLIKDDDKIIGTGSIAGNEINRLFVLPQYQRLGYGTIIMEELEKIIFQDYSEIILDASLPAFDMYLKRGYVPIEYHKVKTEKGHYLCYHLMKKSISA